MRRRLSSAAPTLVAPLVVVALVLALGALGACGAAGGTKEEAKARHLPEGSYPISLHPGKYRSEVFEPSFSFHVGKGWENNRLETSDKLAISRGGEGDPVLVIRNVQEVYNYDKTGTTPEVVKARKGTWSAGSSITPTSTPRNRSPPR